MKKICLHSYFLLTENPYIAPVSPQSITVIEDSSTKLEFMIAVDSDGHTWNKENIYFRYSSLMIDVEDSLSFSVCDVLFPQNYCYTIDRVDRSQEGVYTAFASSKYLFLHI